MFRGRDIGLSIMPLIAFAAAEKGGGGGEPPADGGGENSFATSLTGEGYADFANEQGWKSGDDVVKAFQDQQAGMAGMIRLPGDDSSDEDKAAFNDAVNKVRGVPDKEDGYEFKLPESMPDNLHYDEAVAKDFKAKAKEIGLTTGQAQALHDFQMEVMGKQATGFNDALAAQEAEREQKRGEAHEALTKAWGEEGSEGYNRKHALADRALSNLLEGDALQQEFKDHGVFDDEGAVLMPHFAQALAAIGEQLYAEDGGGDGDSSRPNPYASETLNLTEQGRLKRANPTLARSLILAAGKDPEKYGV